MPSPLSPDDLDPLRAYATPRQAEYLDAIAEHGSVGKAARALGIDRRLIFGALARLRGSVGSVPGADGVHPDAPAFAVRGMSTYYGADGKPRGHWVKAAKSGEDLDAWAEALEALAAPYRGLAKPVRAPTDCTSALLTAYPMGDPHVGMYSYAAETGADFNLQIAERLLCGAVDWLVDRAPASEQALIVNVGDFWHAENTRNTTFFSGHTLDVDTRWSKVLHVGVCTMLRCVQSALRKHKRVRIINAPGNHDPHMSEVLSVVLGAYFANEPRVEVDSSPAHFRYYRHGRCLIGVVHGNGIKPDQLGQIMAVDRAKDWGETVHRYWYTGHVHTRRVFELPGVLVESFRTLAAPDAWTASMGYRSGRDMHAVTLHAEHGEVIRQRVDPAMLADVA